MDTAVIEIGALRTVSVADGTRVSADVDGERLWFESSDADLCALPEVFATALLPLAARKRMRLVLDAGPDPAWSRNVTDVLAVWRRWWGTPGDLESVLEAPRAAAAAPAGRAPAVGLCFTLGVDSFHSLLRSGRSIDSLVFACGYDVELGDTTRMRAIAVALDEVGARTGARPLVVRTNLRRHHVAARMNPDWGLTHGGPLAAVGHACSGELGELIISSTKPVFADRPWGSHWDTDPGWSSSRLRVIHLGAERRRNEKLAALIDEPLVQRHLRVCWENRAPVGNCGECEKCVRTMLILSARGRLGDFPAFPQDGPLAARVDALPAVLPDSIPVYKAVLDELRDRRLRRAIERLIQRSEPPRPPPLRRAAARLRPAARR